MVAVTEVRTTMVPSEDVLPDVLPTERLTATGMAAPELRAELRKIDDVRNVGSVLFTWAHAAVTNGAAVWINHPLSYAAAIVFMGPVLAPLAITGHDGDAKLTSPNSRYAHFHHPTRPPH